MIHFAQKKRAIMIEQAERIVTESSGKWHIDRGMCKCPAHDDSSPSLSVSVSEEGRLLVHCFAGCSQISVIDALKNLRLWPSSNGGRRSRSGKKKAVVHKLLIKNGLTEHQYAFGRYDKETEAELALLFASINDSQTQADQAWSEIEHEWIEEQKWLEWLEREAANQAIFENEINYIGWC